MRPATSEAAAVAVILLAHLSGPAVACPGLDPEARPLYAEITVAAGHGIDPFRMTTRGGGLWNLRDCALGGEDMASFDGDGLVQVRPDVRMRWLDPAHLAISVENEDDTLLVIRDPEGGWHFDDNGRGHNPLVVIPEAQPGEYAIWIGSHGTTALVRPGELVVTSTDGTPAGMSETGVAAPPRESELTRERCLAILADAEAMHETVQEVLKPMREVLTSLDKTEGQVDNETIILTNLLVAGLVQLEGQTDRSWAGFIHEVTDVCDHLH